MGQDKQLHGISLQSVVQKRTLDQALNAKEFSVLAGISYSAARAWFRSPGFPVFHGVVFWKDFVMWRQNQSGIDIATNDDLSRKSLDEPKKTTVAKLQFSGRAAEILAEAG